MVSIDNRCQRQHQHLKRKNRRKQQLYLGSPQVPLRKVKHQQQHELLSDWAHAS